MVGVPRSQRLLAFHFTSAEFSPAFYVPEGHIVLVKDVHVANGAAVAITVTAFIQIPAADAQVRLFSASVAAGAIGDWAGFTVAHPGDYVQAYADGAGLMIGVFGAVLAGPPLFPPAELQDPQLYPPTPGFLPAQPAAPVSAAGLPRRRRSI